MTAVGVDDTQLPDGVRSGGSALSLPTNLGWCLTGRRSRREPRRSMSFMRPRIPRRFGMFAAGRHHP